MADIDGLESSAIGGQLMASASTESPFTQSRRIDDSTVAGRGREFMNIHTAHVALAVKPLWAVSSADINELRFCLCRTSAWWKLLSIIQLTMEHSLFISTKYNPLNPISYSRIARSSALRS